MYKEKTGKDDETLSKTRDLICPDTDKLPVAGDGTKCKGSEPCSYYSFDIHRNESRITDHCNPLQIRTLLVVINFINPKLTVDDFDDPWSYEIDTEWSTLSETQHSIMIINHFYTTLETDARRFGLKSLSNTEKKLMRNSVVRIDKGPFLTLAQPYLWVI